MKSKGKPQAVKPSPLPWELVDGSDGWTPLDANNEVVGGNWEDKETPALIVRAVNAHAGLVEALRLIARTTTDGDTVAQARAALRSGGSHDILYPKRGHAGSRLSRH